MRFGNASDFTNDGKARISSSILKPGCKRKRERKSFWVNETELTLVNTIETAEPSSSPRRCSPRQEANRVERATAQENATWEQHPLIAALERGRVLPARAPRKADNKGHTRGPAHVRTTKESKIPIQHRVKCKL